MSSGVFDEQSDGMMCLVCASTTLKKKKNNCAKCGRPFCKRTCGKKVVVASLGSTEPQLLCNRCIAVVVTRLGQMKGIKALSPTIAEDEIVLIEKLGGGKFGVVWKGSVRGQAVAVKMPRGSIKQDAFDRFIQEVNVMSRINHPNVVRLYGACFTGGKAKIIMELFGYDVEKILFDTRFHVSLPRRLEWLHQVALGCCWIHGGHFVHLDLKPGNILVDPMRDLVKICDLGTAYLIEFGRAQLIESGISGTPAYVAPELYSKGIVSPSCDVFSFGICCFEFATRTRAYSTFSENSVKQLLKRVVDGARPWSNRSGDRWPGAPPASFSDLAKLCCESNFQDRPVFRDIVEKFPRIIVESSIPQQHGLFKLWTNMGTNEGCAPFSFEKFFTELELLLECKADYSTKMLIRELFAENIKDALVAELYSTRWVVKLEHVGKVSRFLPILKLGANSSWLTDVVDLARQSWFFGELERDRVDRKLVKSGSFLIYFSAQPPHYCMSANIDGTLVHAEIKRQHSGTHVVLLSPSVGSLTAGRYASLEQLAEQAALLGMAVADGSPFQWIFSTQTK